MQCEGDSAHPWLLRIALLFKDYPEQIWVARKDSPMIIGVQDEETYMASDVPAILKYTRQVYYIGNHEMACLEKGKVTFYNLDGDVIEKQLTQIDWDAEAAEKGGFEHFMMKEIHEQPKAVSDTINSVVKEDKIDLSEAGLTMRLFAAFSKSQWWPAAVPTMWGQWHSMCLKIWLVSRCVPNWRLSSVTVNRC